MHSSIPARAGLVALVFALIISPISAVPIPIHTPHSDLIQHDTGRLAQIAQIPLKNPISTLPATTGVLTGDNSSVDADNQLVRRNARINAKIRSGFKKMADGIVHAAHKVGTFIKHTGATIAKFGLRVFSSLEGLAAKAIGLIPGVGKIVGKVMEASSKLTGFISDKIHAHMSSRLQKGFAVMHKAEEVEKKIPL